MNTHAPVAFMVFITSFWVLLCHSILCQYWVFSTVYVNEATEINENFPLLAYVAFSKVETAWSVHENISGTKREQYSASSAPLSVVPWEGTLRLKAMLEKLRARSALSWRRIEAVNKASQSSKLQNIVWESLQGVRNDGQIVFRGEAPKAVGVSITCVSWYVTA